jgi:deoxyribonuclease V
VPVIGVAKTAFHASRLAVPVLRGESRRPLLVTTVGVEVHDAAACIQRMHGPSRLPTLLKRVDRLCREA